MAISIYKTFTRGKLTYQDLNSLQAYFRDYINNSLQLITDCVSTNTANKVVKRDASGNFAAGTITANLTGDVTGNVTGDLKTGSTIDGHAITDILESDGVTAKVATELSGAAGGKWVEIVNSSQLMTPGTTNIELRPSNQHNMYIYSVYSPTSGFKLGIGDTNDDCAFIWKRNPFGNIDLLSIYVVSSSKTVYYKVLVWE